MKTNNNDLRFRAFCIVLTKWFATNSILIRLICHNPTHHFFHDVPARREIHFLKSLIKMKLLTVLLDEIVTQRDLALKPRTCSRAHILIKCLITNDCVSVRNVSGLQMAPTLLVRDRLVADDA